MPKETWRWLILTCILVPFLLVHLFFALDRDGGTFLTIAQGLLDGRLPYRDFFDHKPPGIYYALSVPLALSKGSVWAAKVFLLLVAVGTLGLIAWALRTLRTDHRAVWWSIAFGALGWVVYQGYTLVTETLMACMVAGALISLTSDKPRVGLAGFLIGLATLFKQPALLFLIPLLVYTSLVCPVWAPWKAIIGFAAALFIGGSLLIALGIGRNAWEQVVLANLLAPPIGELREIIKGDFQRFLEGSPLWVTAGLPLLSQFRDRRILLLASMLAMAWLPALLNPTPHYLLPAVPIAATLAGMGIRELEQYLANRLAPALVLLTLFPLWVSTLFPTAAAFSHMALFQQIQAGWTLANLSNPDEPILVVAAEPQYYFLAHRYPPGKDLYLLAINYTPQKEMEMIGHLQSGQVSVIATVDTPPTSRYASRIRTYVETHCRLAASFPDLALNIWKCYQ